MGETQENWVTCYHLQSVQLSCSVVSDSSRPHGLQHARLPCPLPTPGACNHLILCCPLLLPSIFPSIRAFSNESVLRIRCQSIVVSASASALSMNIPDWFPFGWTGWISLLQGTLKSLLQHHSSKASILRHSAFFMVQLSHPYMTTGKTIALTRQTFVGKVMSLLFNMLSRLVIAFLPRSKRLSISWLQSPSAVILEPKKIKSVTISKSICMKWWDQMPWSSFFEGWVLGQLFHSPLSLCHHLQPKTKEDVGDDGLGLERVGRQFIERSKSKGLLSKCLLTHIETSFPDGLAV